MTPEAVYPDIDPAWTHLEVTSGRKLLVIDLNLARHGLAALPPEAASEIDCIRVLQFLTGDERVALFNELHRVLQPGGKIHVVVPYFSHSQAFAHPHTQWPPFSEWSFYFTDRAWRSEKPERFVRGLICDFEVGPFAYDYDDNPYGDRLQYALQTQEWLEDAARWYNNVIVYLHVWLTKK